MKYISRDEASKHIRVSREVFDGVDAVRRSGFTNMLDRPCVVGIARGMGFEEAALWVAENCDLYARAVFWGFEVEEEPK